MPQSISELLASLNVQDQRIASALAGWLESALSEQGSIPKFRFDEVITQRNQLRQDADALRAELDALRRQAEAFGPEQTQRLHDENTALKDRLARLLQEQWAPYAAWFQPGHPHHDKAMRIADEFHLPGKGQSLTLEQVEQNLRAIRPYIRADYFAGAIHHDSTPPAGRVPLSQPADLRRIFSTFGG